MHDQLKTIQTACPLDCPDLCALDVSVQGGRVVNITGAEDHPVTSDWITDAELEANPGLVKTMAVAPPMGQGRVRLVRIGAGDPPVDLQPCGGTHVRSTAEIGRISFGKIEKKGRQNRRVSLTFAEDA